jgi:hypothetical protein
MLYQMLTGNVPRGMFTMPSVMMPGTDPRFDAIIAKAMKYDRDERYPSSAELRRDLDVILTTPMVQAGGQASAAIPMQAVAQKPGPKQPSAPSPNPKSPIRNPKSKQPLFIGIGAAAIAVIAFFVFGGSDKTKDSNPREASGVRAASDNATSLSQGQPLTSKDKPTPAPTKSPGSPKSTTPAKAVPPLLQGSATALQDAATKDNFPVGKWVHWFSKESELPIGFHSSYPEATFDKGWFRSSARKQVDLPFRSPVSNLAIRVHLVRKTPAGDESSAGSFGIALRTGNARYQLKPLDNTFICLRYNDDTPSKPREEKQLFRVPAQLPITLNKDTAVLFAVVGNRLVARADRDFFHTVIDDVISSGGAYISGMDDFGDIEVLNLEGLSETDALKLLDLTLDGKNLRDRTLAQSNAGLKPNTTFPPGQWVKVFTKSEDLPDHLRKTTSGASGLKDRV